MAASQSGSGAHPGGSGSGGSGSGNGRRRPRPRPPQVNYVVAKRADVLRGGANKQAFELICPGDVLRVHRLAVKNRTTSVPRAGWALVTLYYAADSVRTVHPFNSQAGYDASKLKSPRPFTRITPGVGGIYAHKGWTRISVFRGAVVAGYEKRDGHRFTRLNRSEPYATWAKRIERSSKGPNRLLEYIPCLVRVPVEFLRFVGKDSATNLSHREIQPERAPHYPALQPGHVVAVARDRTITRSRWLAKIARFFGRWEAWVRRVRNQASTLPDPPPVLPPGQTHLDWFLAEYLQKLVPGLPRLRNQYTHFGDFSADARIVERNNIQYVAVLGRAAGSSAGECGGFGYIKLADFQAGHLVPVTRLGPGDDLRRRFWRISGASPSSDSRGNQPGVQLVYPSRAIALEFNKFIDLLFQPDGSLRPGRTIKDALFTHEIEHKTVNLPVATVRPKPPPRRASKTKSKGFVAVVDYYVTRKNREPRAS